MTPPPAPEAGAPRHAVLFKVQDWDDFIARQFCRLARRVGAGDLFVLADETRGEVRGIIHDRVVRMTEATARDEGFPIQPAGDAFQHNGDYPLYHFTRLYPDYDYLVLVEHDCIVQVAIDDIIAAMAAERLDFVGERPRGPADGRVRRAAAPYYPPEVEITSRLVCCAAFSRDFVLDLASARLEHAGRVALDRAAMGDAYQSEWPNAEGLIGCEIARRGARERALAHFGDVSLYNRAPAMPEALLPRLAASGFIHPILDTRRFLDSLEKIGQTLDGIFEPGSYLGRILAEVEPAPLLAGVLHELARRRDLPGIEKLRELADRRGAGEIFNVARGKPATQSSLSQHSRGRRAAEDAAGAVTGAATGRHGFHTGFEPLPWWCLDLEDIYPVREIRVFNRLELAERAATLVVTASMNMTDWAVLHDHGGAAPFGGADGRPLRILLPEPTAIRFVRLGLAGTGYLHLDEVEVYV